MTTKSDQSTKPLEAEREAGGHTVVLRDESDEIIDNLKQQLASLQGQLDQYKASESGGGAVAPPEPPDIALATWNAELTPRLTDRLQTPAKELTERLERIIDKVQDPGLREELERCRETAFFLFDTFRRISDNHQTLTDSLTDTINHVAATDFSRLLEHLLGSRATPLVVTRTGQVPQRLAFRTESALSLLQKLARLIDTVTESEMSVELDFQSAAGGNGADFVCVRLMTANPWAQLENAEHVSSVAFRPGTTAQTVVDLLYVEKIVELQGGTLTFHLQNGEVHGFEARLPAAAVQSPENN